MSFSLRDVHITRADPEEMPWSLLLDADPSKTRVESYLSDQFTRIAKYEGEVVGVYALVKQAPMRF